jgi:hypothetical protein
MQTPVYIKRNKVYFYEQGKVTLQNVNTSKWYFKLVFWTLKKLGVNVYTDMDLYTWQDIEYKHIYNIKEYVDQTISTIYRNGEQPLCVLVPASEFQNLANMYIDDQFMGMHTISQMYAVNNRQFHIYGDIPVVISNFVNEVTVVPAINKYLDAEFKSFNFIVREIEDYARDQRLARFDRKY